MPPLIDKTLLDAPLLATARAAVAARRGGSTAGALSEKAQAVKEFLAEHGDEFGCASDTVEEFASLLLGERVGSGMSGTRVGQMFVPTTSTYGYKEGATVLIVDDYGIAADGTVGQRIPEGTDISGYAREATDAEVEAYFTGLKMTDAIRTSFSRLAVAATGIRA